MLEVVEPVQHQMRWPVEQPLVDVAEPVHVSHEIRRDGLSLGILAGNISSSMES